VPEVDKAPSLIVTKHNHTIKLQQYSTHNRENLPETRRGSTSPPTTTDDKNIGLHSTERPRPVRKTRLLFLYSAEVKNVGAKKIDAVVWDYVFVRAADGKVLGKLRFLSKSGIRPDKSKRLSTQTLERPPLTEVSMVVNVTDLGKEEVPQYSEKVEIKFILYADGTWWRHPTMPMSDCENLIKDNQRKGR
jgi:hypothetical protein